jgi:hypothetical protein
VSTIVLNGLQKIVQLKGVDSVMIEQPSKESDMSVSAETKWLSTAKPSSQRPFSRGDDLPVISSRHLVLSLALLAIAITPSTAQNHCASTPPT